MKFVCNSCEPAVYQFAVWPRVIGGLAASNRRFSREITTGGLSVWDFFTYSSKERDCWERHNVYCRDVYIDAKDKEKALARVKAVKDSRKAYADLKGEDEYNPKMWWNMRRRLGEMETAGSKTATVWLRFLFPHKSYVSCSGGCK